MLQAVGENHVSCQESTCNRYSANMSSTSRKSTMLQMISIGRERYVVIRTGSSFKSRFIFRFSSLFMDLRISSRKRARPRGSSPNDVKACTEFMIQRCNCLVYFQVATAIFDMVNEYTDFLDESESIEMTCMEALESGTAHKASTWVTLRGEGAHGTFSSNLVSEATTTRNKKSVSSSRRDHFANTDHNQQLGFRNQDRDVVLGTGINTYLLGIMRFNTWGWIKVCCSGKVRMVRYPPHFSSSQAWQFFSIAKYIMSIFPIMSTNSVHIRPNQYSRRPDRSITHKSTQPHDLNACAHKYFASTLVGVLLKVSSVLAEAIHWPFCKSCCIMGNKRFRFKRQS